MNEDTKASTLKQYDFAEDKFRELLVYIATRSTDDPTFGSVKLNKVLYYSDFASYRLLGKPITGATYQKLREGPAPRELLECRSDLIASGTATIQLRPYFTRMQKTLVISPERVPDTEIFDPGELQLVRRSYGFFPRKNSTRGFRFVSSRAGLDSGHRQGNNSVRDGMAKLRPYRARHRGDGAQFCPRYCLVKRKDMISQKATGLRQASARF